MTVIVSGTLITKSGGLAFTGLNDTPSSYTGEAGKVVAVNGTEDGLEFITGGGGSATALEPFRSNTTITVGTLGGEDYATLEEAIDYVMSRNLGSDAQGNGNTPRVTIQLSAETHTLAGQLKVDNLNLQLAIYGDSSTTTTLDTDGNNLVFSDCLNVRLDDMAVVGVIQNAGSLLLFGPTSGDLDMSSCELQSSREGIMRFESYPNGSTVKNIDMYGGGRCQVYGPLVFTPGNITKAVISLRMGSEFATYASSTTSDITMDLTNYSGTQTPIVADSGSTVNIISSLTVTNDVARTNFLHAAEASTIFIAGGVTSNAANVASFPIGQLQEDGSSVYDGTTPTSTQSGGGGAVDSVFGRTGVVVADAGDYAGIYLEPFTADVTYTVGPTGGTPGTYDFDSLADALAYVMSRNVGTGLSPSANGLRPPRVTLDLQAGTHTGGTQLRVSNLNVYLSILGPDSTTTTVTADYFVFNSCVNVRLDGFKFIGSMQNSDSDMLLSWDAGDLDLSECQFWSSYHDGYTRVQNPTTFRRINLEGGNMISLSDITFACTGFDTPLLLNYNTTLSVIANVILDVSAGTGTLPLVVASEGSSITIDGDLTATGGPTKPALIDAYLGGTVQVSGTITKGNSTDIALFPLGQIQADGSAIYDSVTPTSTQSGGGSSTGTGIVVYTVPTDYATVPLALAAAQTSGAQKVIISMAGETWTMSSDLQWWDDNWPDLEFIGGTIVGNSSVQNIWFYNANSKLTFNNISLRNVSLGIDGACECVMHNVTLLSGGANFTYPEVYLNQAGKLIITNQTGRFSRIAMTGASTLISSDNLDIDTVDVSTVITLQDASRAIIAGSIAVTSTTNTTGDVITCGDESSLQCGGITANGQTGGTVITVTEIATATVGTIAASGGATASSPAGTTKSPTVYI